MNRSFRYANIKVHAPDDCQLPLNRVQASSQAACSEAEGPVACSQPETKTPTDAVNQIIAPGDGQLLLSSVQAGSQAPSLLPCGLPVRGRLCLGAPQPLLQAVCPALCALHLLHTVARRGCGSCDSCRGCGGCVLCPARSLRSSGLGAPQSLLQAACPALCTLHLLQASTRSSAGEHAVHASRPQGQVQRRRQWRV